MPQKIKHSDVVSESLFAPTVKELQAAHELVLAIKKDLPKGSDISLIKPDSVENIRKINTEVSKTNVSYEQAKKLTEQQLKIEKELSIVRSKAGKDLEVQRQKLNAEKKAARDLAKEKAGLLTLYQKESRRLNELRKSFKDLELSGKGSRKEMRALQREITKLDTKLKNVDAKTGQYQRSVGKYTDALKGIFAKAGLFLGIGALIRGVGNAINIFRDFQQANAKLASILGETRADIKLLTDDAQRLGATTAFTATQVADLQTEFAKLGFSKEEILGLTESTINASIALGSGIGEQATLTGSLLNAYGLDAAEAARVNDVLAKSSTKSALDFEKLKDSFSFVAPTAKALGLTIEETAATLGVLVDNGIKGSRAGRLLSSSFARLNKDGLTLNDALQKINESTDKTKTATELFGKESFTLGLILADNVEKTADLAKEFQNAGGAAEKLAEEQLDTLEGSLTLLKSAWEGFVLSIEDGDGIISKAIRGVVDTFKTLLTIWTDINELGGVQTKDMKEAIENRTKLEEDAFLNRVEQWKEEGKNIDQIITRTEKLIELRKEEVKRSKEEGINSAEFGIALAELAASEKVLLRLKSIKNKQTKETTETTKEETKAIKSNTKAKKDNRKETEKQLTIEQELAALDKQIREQWELDKKAQLEKFDAIEKEADATRDLTDAKRILDEWNAKIAKSDEKKKKDADEEAKRIKEEAEARERAIDSIDKALQDSTARRLRLIDREVEASQRQQDLLTQQAVAGTKDAKESIALERKRQAELEAQREKALRNEKRREVLISGLKTYSSKVEQGDPRALQSTIRDIGLLTSALTSLGGFEEGTEFVGKSGQQMIDLKTPTDRYVTRLDHGERVLTAEQNKALGNITNDHLVRIIQGSQKLPQNIFSLAAPNNTEIITRLDKQNQLLEANLKRATESRDYDVQDKVIEQIFKHSNTTVRTKKYVGGIFGS